jgi:hypothetical protein
MNLVDYVPKYPEYSDEVKPGDKIIVVGGWDKIPHNIPYTVTSVEDHRSTCCDKCTSNRTCIRFRIGIESCDFSNAPSCNLILANEKGNLLKRR